MGTTPDATPGAASAPSPAPGTLEWFNALLVGAARRELLACCVSQAWADPLVADRPYLSVAALLARSDTAVAAMTADDLAAALAGHPRIGERSGDRNARSAGWSRQEQSGVDGADSGTSRALADGNAAYEHRFGHIYLVCASGRSAAELLALLHARLGNDPAAEWLIVSGELQKINQLRLRKLVTGPAALGGEPGRTAIAGR